jgi:hypothetical protein
MSARFRRALIANSAGLAVASVLILCGAAVARASSAGPAAHGATPECLILPSCLSVYQFGPVSAPELVLQAAGAFPGAPVVMAADDFRRPGQDWTYVDLGTVASYKHRGLRVTLPINKFDIVNYGPDEVYQLEFTPDGHASGYCAANVSNRMVLRVCNGSQFQTLIAVSVLGRGRGAPVSYWYGLSAAHVPGAAEHLSVTGSRSAGAQVTFTVPVSSDQQFWQPG